MAGFAGTESPEGETGFCRKVPGHNPGADQKPEVRLANKEQIKEKAKESIRDRLARGKIEADRANRERMERRTGIKPVTKKGMEI